MIDDSSKACMDPIDSPPKSTAFSAPAAEATPEALTGTVKTMKVAQRVLAGLTASTAAVEQACAQEPATPRQLRSLWHQQRGW